MIILDTNIISEMMKPSPSPQVIEWIDQQAVMKLFITTITIAEINYGINALPEGERQTSLQRSFNKALIESFKHRILFFDDQAAFCYGKIMGKRKILGRPLSVLDGQIAAIALTHESPLATRNTRDFIDCGLELINPFNLPV